MCLLSKIAESVDEYWFWTLEITHEPQVRMNDFHASVLSVLQWLSFEVSARRKWIASSGWEVKIDTESDSLKTIFG